MALIADVNPGDPGEADWANAIRDQGVQVCLSSGRPSPAAEGMVIFETDTNLLQYYNGSAWVEIVRDGDWVDVAGGSFTITQGGALSKTVFYARYRRSGSMLRWRGAVEITSAGTSTTAIIISLPSGFTMADAAASGARILPIGTGTVFDGSVGGSGAHYAGIASPASSSTFGLLPTSTATSNYLGAVDMTAALTTQDEVTWDVEVELS